MQNDYTKDKQNQGFSKENTADFGRSAVREETEKFKELAATAQKKLKEGQEQATQIISSVDKHVRENPWPVVASVAIGSFLLGCLIGTSRRN